MLRPVKRDALASNGPEEVRVFLKTIDHTPRREDDGSSDDVIARETEKAGEVAHSCMTDEGSGIMVKGRKEGHD